MLGTPLLRPFSGKAAASVTPDRAWKGAESDEPHSGAVCVYLAYTGLFFKALRLLLHVTIINLFCSRSKGDNGDRYSPASETSKCAPLSADMAGRLWG